MGRALVRGWTQRPKQPCCQVLLMHIWCPRQLGVGKSARHMSVRRMRIISIMLKLQWKRCYLICQHHLQWRTLAVQTVLVTAAHAEGQCIESDSAQMQLLGDEQNWQPKKKIKIAFTSSRVVYRGSALDAANDPTQSPKMSAAPFLAQGSPVAAPSWYNHSSMRG